MKKVLYISLASIVTLFYSCSNEPPVVITTSNDVLTMNPLNGNQSLTISANSTWKAKSSDSWCTLSDSTGTGNKSIVLLCNDNLTGLARATKVSIQAGDQSKSVVVNQSGGEILLDEDFIDNSRSWILQYDSVASTINNGFFDIKNTGNYYSYTIGTKSLIPLYLGNYMISTHYKTISGTAPFGLTFGYKDAYNFYRILVYPTGGCVISQKSNNAYTTKLSASSSLIKNENTISLVKDGNNCNIYINGSNVGTFDYSTPYGSYVGFYSCPRTEIAVDYFKVIQF